MQVLRVWARIPPRGKSITRTTDYPRSCFMDCLLSDALLFLSLFLFLPFSTRPFSALAFLLLFFLPLLCQYIWIVNFVRGFLTTERIITLLAYNIACPRPSTVRSFSLARHRGYIANNVMYISQFFQRHQDQTMCL